MLKNYLKQFGINEFPEENKVFKLGDRFFFQTTNAVLDKSVVYAGRYLGMKYNNKFVPGIDLLGMIEKQTKQFVVVNKRAEWLVVCGRDVWGTSIVEKGKEFAKDEIVLVLSEEKEALGVGRVLDVDLSKNNKVIKMQFDIGDLIRRGKKTTRQEDEKNG